MRSDDRSHELLPWYATGQLEAREAEEFREHLASCEACREELDFVESVKAGVETDGDEFFRDHPSTERLVGAVMGHLDRPRPELVVRLGMYGTWLYNVPGLALFDDLGPFVDGYVEAGESYDLAPAGRGHWLTNLFRMR